jgi:peroxiredoxin Q/BCP
MTISATEQIKIGDQAPTFSLHAYANGKDAGQIELADYIGKKNVILAFYPKDQTPGCTKEMCAFSEDLTHFENAGTQVLGISVDSVDSHEKFAAKYELKQPLLADVGGVVGKQYGAVKDGAANASRITFVIDKRGIVQNIIEGMPTNAQLLDVVKTLK